MRKSIVILSVGLLSSLASGLYQTADGGERVLSEEERREQEQIEAMFQREFQEEDVYRAQELVLTATGSLKPVRLAPSVATVISKEEIEAIGATTLDEILETVPGLHVSPSGLNIFSSIWSIRGISTSINPQVLLLINGVPLTDVANGGRPQAFKMPVSMISRVEIVRGPGSAVHGADAFAGTVNVITKDGHEVDGTRGGVRYGSFDTSDLWLQHGGTYGSWDMVAGIETQKSAGDEERIVERDSLGSGPPSLAPGELDTRYETFNINLGLNREDRWIFHFYGQWHNDNAMGPGGSQTLNYDSVSDGRKFLADLNYRNDEWFQHWDINLQATFSYLKVDNHFQYYPSEYLNMRGEPIVTTKTSGVETSAFYRGFMDHTFRMAIGTKFFDTNTDQYKNFGPAVTDQFGPLINIDDTPYNFLNDQNRKLWYVSLQDEWHIAPAWELTGGIRFDEYDDFGSTINPRLALVWETTYELTSKLMYGRAFRAPSFSEQYFQNNPVVTGNADLEPETIDTYELAFVYEPTPDMRIIPSFFYYEIDGLIEYVGSLPAPAENAIDQKGHGFELDIKWDVLKSLRVQCNWSFQRSRDQQTHEIVADTPEWKFYFNSLWQFHPDWSLDGQYFWIGGRHRTNDDIRDEIDDYSLVNLALRRKNINKYFDVALAVRNLFNHDVREPSPYDPSAPEGAYIPDDYPMESRSIWGEFRFHF